MDELYKIVWPYVQPLVLGLPRIGIMLLILPTLPDAIVPRLVRAVFAISLLLGMYPMLQAQIPVTSFPNSLPFLLAKELCVGALLGVALSSLFWAIQSVGALIDNQVGTNTAEIFDPFGGHSGGPWASFTSMLCSVLFVSLGGFQVCYSLLVESFVVWPLSSDWITLNVPITSLGESVARDVAANALRLAMPVIFLLCIVELGLGLINRAAPQLNVFAIAMPIKAALAALIVAVSFSHFVEAIDAHLKVTIHWLASVTTTNPKN
jgi:type III secretion protein T